MKIMNTVRSVFFSNAMQANHSFESSQSYVIRITKPFREKRKKEFKHKYKIVIEKRFFSFKEYNVREEKPDFFSIMHSTKSPVSPFPQCTPSRTFSC